MELQNAKLYLQELYDRLPKWNTPLSVEERTNILTALQSVVKLIDMINSMSLDDFSNNMLLYPCPFCGEQESLKLIQQESQSIDEDMKLPYAICCSIHSHGCGATGGYYNTPIEAITAWNRRSNND